MTLPTQAQFEAWSLERQAWREQNVLDWGAAIARLFPDGIPSQFSWTRAGEITKTLREVTALPNSNHMFFPRGGGLDLTKATLSSEIGCIELETDGTATIVRPVRLLFEAVNDDPNGMYFRLETAELRPSGIYEVEADEEWTREELTRLGPNDYGARWMWDEGHIGTDDEGKLIPLPPEAQLITRASGGTYVIFAKGSVYNQDPATYDARHNRMSAVAFKDMIARAIHGNV